MNDNTNAVHSGQPTGQPNFRRKTLEQRIIVYMAAVLFVAMLLLSAIAYHILLTETIGARERIVDYIASSVAGGINTEAFYISSLSDSPTANHLDVQSQLDSVMERIPSLDFLEIMFLENDRFIYYAEGIKPGETRQRTGFRQEVPPSAIHMDYARLALTEGGTVRSPRLETNRGLLVSGFSPILDNNGRTIGLVTAHIDVGYLYPNALRLGGMIAGGFFIYAVIFIFVMRRRIARSTAYVLKRIVEADHTFSDKNAILHSRNEDSIKPVDDIAILYAHFGEMFASFEMLIKDIGILADSHIAGQCSVRLDESKYVGGHRELVKRINMMVNDYVVDIQGLINVMQSFGMGQFDVELPDWPGEWTWIHETLTQLRGNFIHVTSEINKLAENAADGHFDVPAHIGNQQGEWAQLINKLNTLLDAIEAPLLELENGMDHMAKGESMAITGQYKGRFKAIKDAYNTVDEFGEAMTEEISKILSAIASGDLTLDIKANYVGSYATIRESLETILKSLNTSIKRISETADSVLNGADALNNSSNQLARASTEQSSSIEEVHASISMIEQNTRDSAARAKDADVLARQTRQRAMDGDKEMQEMVDRMGAIKESSNNISSVIKVIQDIAFQTNLLALNASVEASRAGVHGAGFSVVAEEVRSLASRSQGAVEETSGLIADALNQVDAGTTAVQGTATSLVMVEEDIVKIVDIISKIAVISAEQADAITQVSDGITQISEIVQSNAATSEECSAVASEFSERAQQLKDLVAFYKTDI